MLLEGFVIGSSAIATHGLSGDSKPCWRNCFAGIMFLGVELASQIAAQQCVHPTWGGLRVFLGSFLASAESRFDGEFTLSPQAGNAGR